MPSAFDVLTAMAAAFNVGPDAVPAPDENGLIPRPTLYRPDDV